MKSKFCIQDIIIIVALASTLLYIVASNLPIGMGSFRFLWGPATLLILLVSRPNIIINGPLKLVLLYGVLSLGVLNYTLWVYMSEWNQIQFLNEFYPLVVMTTIWSYYWIKKDYFKLAHVSKWAFVFIVITLITTNVALSYDPYIVRVAASGEFTPYQERIRQLTGAAGYGYAQSFVLLIPLLVYHIKKRQRMVFPWLMLMAVLVLLIVTLARAQVFANFVAGIFITILAFIGFHNRRKTYVVALIIGMLIVIIPSSFYTNVIVRVSDYFEPGTEMHAKLTDAALVAEFESIEAGRSVSGRADRYPMLLEALLARPFTGNASYNSQLDVGGGGHLYWMNKLAWWGIPGFLFFVFVLFKVFSQASKALPDQEIRYYYFLSVLAFIMLGLMKNIGGREPWAMLILVIPGLYYLPFLKQSKSKADDPSQQIRQKQ